MKGNPSKSKQTKSMKALQAIILAVAVAAITAATARPLFKSDLGVVSGKRGHYEFSNAYDAANGRKRDVTPEAPQLSYTADVKENVHSLDLEESIDSVECTADSLTLHLTSKDAVHRWGRRGFYVSGGAEWGCEGGVILRRVKNVEWTGSDAEGRAVARLTTAPAQYTDVFKRAHVSFKQLIPNVRSDLQVVPRMMMTEEKKSNNKGRRDEAVPTLGSKQMMYFDEFPMDPEEDVSDEDPDERAPSNAKLVIHSPVESDGFNNGDYINVTWSYTGKVADTDYWVVVLSSGKGKGIAYQSERLGPGERSVIGMLETAESGAAYTVYVTLYNKKDKSVKSGTRGPYYVNYPPDFIMLSPTGADSYQSGDLMTVAWDHTEAMAKQKVQLYLCAYDDGAVSCTKKGSVVASRGNFTVKCDGKMKKDGEFFWRLSYNCGMFSCGNTVNGKLFIYHYTRDIKERLFVENPSVGSAYHSGDVIPMRWAHQDFADEETVRVRLCVQRWGFNKCYQDYGSVRATLGGANLLVPAGLPDSTHYYVSVNYHCNGAGRKCKRAESKRFAINHDPKIRFTSPTYGQVIEPGRVAATWTSTELKPTDEVYVTLRKKLPLVYDPLYLIPATHSTAVKVPVGAGEYAFDVSEGFYTPAYFTIRYNCLMGKYLCHEEASPLFTIPDVRHAGWNYDPARGGAAIDPYPLYEYSCADCANEPANTTNLFCLVCNKWHEELDFKSQCENCYVGADFVMYDLTLDIELGAVIACTFSLNGTAVVNIGKFHNRITADYQHKLAMHLLSFPISGFPFKVGGVNIGTDFILNVDMETLFTYNSAIDLGVSFSRKADLWGRLEYGTTTRDGIFVTARHYDGPTPTGLSVSGTATASAAVGVKVSISADLSLICSLTVWAEPVFTPRLAFSYPAYPAKKSSSSSDICSAAHYAEYAVDFDFYHGGEGKVVFPRKHFSNTTHDLYIRVLDGCFLPAKTPAPTLSAVLSAPLEQAFPAADARKTAIAALTHEAARAIEVDPSAVYIPENMALKSIQFFFMDADTVVSAKARDALKLELDDPDSALWAMPAFQAVKPLFVSSH